MLFSNNWISLSFSAGLIAAEIDGEMDNRKNIISVERFMVTNLTKFFLIEYIHNSLYVFKAAPMPTFKTVMISVLNIKDVVIIFTSLWMV